MHHHSVGDVLLAERAVEKQLMLERGRRWVLEIRMRAEESKREAMQAKYDAALTTIRALKGSRRAERSLCDSLETQVSVLKMEIQTLEQKNRALLLNLECEKMRVEAYEVQQSAIDLQVSSSEVQAKALESMSQSLEARLLLLDDSMESSGNLFPCRTATSVPSPPPMENPSILDRVFGFVGRGRWIYVAGVSKLFLEVYGLKFGRGISWAGNIFDSLTCLELGCRTGVNLNMQVKYFFTDANVKLAKPMGFLAGYKAETNVILRARELGMKFDRWVAKGCARAGRVKLLQELHNIHGAPISFYNIFSSAARAPDPAVMQWLKKTGKGDGAWGKEDMTLMMGCAAECGRIKNARWLKEEGADWGSAIYCAVCYNQTDFIKWARENEAPWNWEKRACTFAAEEGANANTLHWLHAQPGFPCSCTKNGITISKAPKTPTVKIHMKRPTWY
jgi:hypothetical protein